MTNDEIAQLSILEIVVNGWRLALENPISTLLVILPFSLIFLFSYKYLEENSIRGLFASKTEAYEARKKLGIREK